MRAYLRISIALIEGNKSMYEYVVNGTVEVIRYLNGLEMKFSRDPNSRFLTKFKTTPPIDTSSLINVTNSRHL